MNKTLWQKLQPHVLAIGIFLLISIFYCLPALQGKVVNQSDVIGWKGMAQSSFEFKEKYGHFPLWTNSLFGGMPAYQVALESKYNITIAWFHYLFTGFLPTPAGLFFLSCIGFYILSLVLSFRTWIGIFGSLGFAFCSYSPILAEVGHTTKLAAMGYMPAILAGFLLLTQRKYILGFLALMLFTTLQLYQNHIQITYYTILLLAFAAIVYGILKLKEKGFKEIGITAGLSVVAGLIAAGSYAVMLMPLNEYAKETMRGGRSELTLNKPKEDKTKGGLDKEYAFRWSYGIDESLTFILAYANGGSSNPNELGENPKVVEVMQDAQIPENGIQYFRQFLSPYWGDQPSTSGPVYFGIFIILFAIVGLVLVRNWNIGWIIGVSMLGILMAWGRHFSAFNYFLFDYLPLYGKFRAPSMSLVLPQLCLSILAAMGLQEMLYGKLSGDQLWKKLKPALFITGGLIAVMLVAYISFDFKGNQDKNIRDSISQMLGNAYAQGQQPTDAVIQKANSEAGLIMNGLVEDRKRLFTGDLIRSIIFFLIGGAIVFYASRRKINSSYVAIGVTILSFIDLMGVDLRYFNHSKFIDEQELMDAAFTPNNADLAIKQDTGYFRVFDQTENFTNESRSAYFHNSIGGYHPAKLALYQDLIENQLSKGNIQVLNMLNTKYVIISNPQTRQPMAMPNPDALGPAWFVKAIRPVQNANEEMLALDSIRPRDTAFIDKRELSKINQSFKYDSASIIKLIENRNDYIEYQSQSATDGLGVFSEIYYPHGWKASIDGKEVAIARVDYLLRAVSIPSGTHKIEFRFEPDSIKKGDMISLAIGIISWLLLLGGLFWIWKQSRTSNKAVSNG